MLCSSLNNVGTIVISSTGGSQEIPACLNSANSLTGAAFTGLTIVDFARFPSSLTSFTAISCTFSPSSSAIGFRPNGDIGWQAVFNYLPSLRSFYVSASILTGTLPTTLPSGMTSFVVTSSGLTGSIPSTLLENHASVPSLLQLMISLSFNSLNGTIPSSLFAPIATKPVSSFITIEFDHNKLSGTIPGAWLDPFASANASSFYLNLASNGLTGSLPAPFFPPNLISPTSTQAILSLQLASNSLNGTIPPNLFDGFPTLLSLIFDATSNRLSGTLPSPLVNMAWASSQFSNFNVLLGNNLLTGTIPSPFISSKFTDSTIFGGFSLQLYNNQLEGTIPPDLLNRNGAFMVGSPFMLVLANNRLEGEIPPTLLDTILYSTGSSSTYTFNVQNNLLSGSLPNSLLSTSAAQATISVSNNFFTGPLPAPCNAGPLYAVDFSRNKLSGTISTNWGGCAFGTLDVSSNANLTGEIKASLLNDSYLRLFNASRTRLSGTLPATRLKSALKIIDLSYSNLTFCSASSSLGTAIFADFVGNCYLDYTEACDCVAAYPKCSTACRATVSKSCLLSARPSIEFECIGGIWTAPTVTSPVLSIPSGGGTVKITGNVTSSSIVFGGLGSIIIVEGCTTNLSTIVVELSPAEVEKLGNTKLNQTLIVLSSSGSACNSLSNVAISSSHKSDGCKKLKVDKVVSNDGTTLSGLFSIDSSGCNKWWIILVSVIAAIVFVALVVGIVLAACWSRIREEKFTKQISASK